MIVDNRIIYTSNNNIYAIIKNNSYTYSNCITFVFDFDLFAKHE